MRNAIRQNGVLIVRTPTGVGVACNFPNDRRLLTVECHLNGLLLKAECIDSCGHPWRDHFAGTDMLAVGVRVKDGDAVLAELPAPGDDGVLPFMRLQGEQVHVTENYVSVPPALTVTDEVGAVWTLGFTTAPRELSPQGEFAFDVLRDGIDTREVASRIERRSGLIRIFTRHGWKRWTGSSFF